MASSRLIRSPGLTHVGGSAPGVPEACGVFVAVGVAVFVAVGTGVFVAVAVAVLVAVVVAVFVAVDVAVAVKVAVGVAVAVAVLVAVGVAVEVAVAVLVGSGVFVAVGVDVPVAVGVGVAVAMQELWSELEALSAVTSTSTDSAPAAGTMTLLTEPLTVVAEDGVAVPDDVLKATFVPSSTVEEAAS